MRYNFKIYGKHLRFEYCPICQKIKLTNPCFDINLENNTYYCHSQGKGGKVEDLKKLGFDFDVRKYKEYKLTKRNNKNLKLNVDFNNLMLERKNKFLGDDWIKYLKGRGISNKHLEKFVRLGKNNSMMIPITNGKEVVGIKYRTMDKKIFSEKGSSSDYLLNWNHIFDNSYLIIVEGEIDLLSVIEAGYENVVSIPFGIKNLKAIENQKEWVSNFKKIIIATDNDKQGKQGKDKIIEILKNVRSKLYKVDCGKYKDFNEILENEGKEKLKKVIKKAEKIDISLSPFCKREDGYYLLKNGFEVKITDFLLEIIGYSDNYISGIVKNNGREKEFFCSKVELLSKEGIVKNLGYYLGTTSSISNFWSWIIDENIEKYIEEIKYYGIIDNKFYDSSSKIICDKKDLDIRKIEEIENFTKEEKEWLNKNIIYMRKDTNQSLLGLCWGLGRFHIDSTYPLLEVAGTTSIGKTEYIEFLIRMMFGTRENIKSFSTLTNHQIRAISSCSNITPWAIDEVKISGKSLKDKAIDLYSTIRSIYDNKIINQGNLTNKLTEFKLCTPLIISGESELSDVSIKNRMISVYLKKENKSEDEIFFKLKNSEILEKLGKYALNNRLNNGKIIIPQDEVRKKLISVNDERQLYNGMCILTGLKALKDIVNINDEIENNFIKYLDRLLSDYYNVIKNFLELLELVKESGKATNHFYQIKNERHFIRFNLLYKAISEEHYLTNSTLELLDMRALKKQLIEEKFIINDRIAMRFPKSEISKELTLTRACEIQKNNIFIKKFLEED